MGVALKLKCPDCPNVCTPVPMTREQLVMVIEQMTGDPEDKALLKEFMNMTALVVHCQRDDKTRVYKT